MKLCHLIATVYCVVLFAPGSRAVETSSVVPAESAQLSSQLEQEGDWLATHESNGPEGDRGIPMQQLSFPKTGLAVLTLLMGVGLALLPLTKPQDNE